MLAAGNHAAHGGLNTRLGQGNRAVIQVAGEGFMRRSNTGVDNGHRLTVALFVHLVSRGHVKRALILHTCLLAFVLRDRERLPVEGVFHAVHSLDAIEHTSGRFDGKTVDDVVIIVQLLHWVFAGVGRLRREQLDAAVVIGAYLLLRNLANAVLEVGVAVLLRATQQVAEQANALRAAILKLHDNGNFFVWVLRGAIEQVGARFVRIGRLVRRASHRR